MAMFNPFEAIEERARERLGGAQALVQRLPLPKSADELRATPDDRYLSDMSRRIFRAGLKYSLVDGKWPVFEEVFVGFAPRRVVAMSGRGAGGPARGQAPDPPLGQAQVGARERHRHDAGRRGRTAAWALTWRTGRATILIGSWADLAKRFTQLGGNSGPYFLRMAGKDTFI